MRKWVFIAIPLLILWVYSCTTHHVPIYVLEATVSPGEGGTVTPTSGEFDDGDTVELRAEAEDGYLFVRWGGDISGSNNPDSLTFDSDKKIEAVFVLKEYTLNIETEGEGSVREEILEEAAKTDYEHGTTVQLTADEDEGWEFVRWEGDLEGSDNPETIQIEEGASVTAVFEVRETDDDDGNDDGSGGGDDGDDDSDETFSLAVSVEGEGTIERDPDREEYENDEDVTVTAVTADGWRFDRWVGDIRGDDNPEEIEMDGPKEVRAVFELMYFDVDFDTEGAGEIDVELLSGDQNMGDFAFGAELEISARAENGWRFSEWREDLNGSDNPERITISRDMDIEAVFEQFVVGSISHEYVEGVTPSEASEYRERTYPVIQAQWSGPGGDKRWLGRNLGATDAPESPGDGNLGRTGWFFQFNNSQGTHWDNRGPGDGSAVGEGSSDANHRTDWQLENDPCRVLLEGSWRVPEMNELEAFYSASESDGGMDGGEADEAFDSYLNLHMPGYIDWNTGSGVYYRDRNQLYASRTLAGLGRSSYMRFGDDTNVHTIDFAANLSTPIRCIED